MRWSVTISAALHVGGVAGLLSFDFELRTEPVVHATAVEIEVIDVDVAVRPEPNPAPKPEPSNAPTHTNPQPPKLRQPTRIETSIVTASIDKPIDVPVDVPADKRRYFDMRTGGRPDLSLPRRDELAPPSVSEPTVTGISTQIGKPSESRPQLEPDGVGKKSDRGPFVAKVDRDGGASFRDRPDVDVEVIAPSPKDIGRGIAEWYESDKGPDGQRGKQTLKGYAQGSIDSGAPHCQVRDNACMGDRSKAVIIPLVGGNFSPTDWIMRKTVGDPYSSKKRAWLDATRDERAEMRAANRKQQLQQIAIVIRKNLEAAWASSTDATQRKEALFALWDEISEPDGTDELLDEACRLARAHVVGFIRARLPQRDKDAYSLSEITALNARRKSSATFSPYD